MLSIFINFFYFNTNDFSVLTFNYFREVDPIEKNTDLKEKVAVEKEDVKGDKKEKDSKPKENGNSETNEKAEPETNGSKFLIFNKIF